LIDPTDLFPFMKSRIREMGAMRKQANGVKFFISGDVKIEKAIYLMQAALDRSADRLDFRCFHCFTMAKLSINRYSGTMR